MHDNDFALESFFFWDQAKWEHGIGRMKETELAQGIHVQIRFQKIFIAFFSLLSFEAYERCVLFPHELAFILCVCVGSNFTDEMAFYLLKSDF